MKKVLLIIVIVLYHYFCFGQRGSFKNEWSVSVPFLWNKTEVTNIIGPRRQIEGEARSYGFNTTYSRMINKGFFVTAGIGYFKQNFNIHRPVLYYDTITKRLYTTKYYVYHCLHSNIGFGYKYQINKYGLKGVFTYNRYSTFKQEYKPLTSNVKQINKRNFLFGESFILEPGGYRTLFERFTIGCVALIPVSTRWRKDRIFDENEAEYYKPKRNIGFSLTTSYHF